MNYAPNAPPRIFVLTIFGFKVGVCVFQMPSLGLGLGFRAERVCFGLDCRGAGLRFGDRGFRFRFSVLGFRGQVLDFKRRCFSLQQPKSIN